MVNCIRRANSARAGEGTAELKRCIRRVAADIAKALEAGEFQERIVGAGITYSSWWFPTHAELLGLSKG